jgi:hypothetical protein
MSTTSTRAVTLRSIASRPLFVGTATIVVAAVVGTLALWAHYGMAVFYETIAAGIARCM